MVRNVAVLGLLALLAVPSVALVLKRTPLVHKVLLQSRQSRTGADTSPALQNLALIATTEQAAEVNQDEEQGRKNAEDEEQDDEQDEDQEYDADVQADEQDENCDNFSSQSVQTHFAGMSQSLRKLYARAEEAMEEADKDGSEEAEEAADQAQKEFEEAFAKDLRLQAKLAKHDNEKVEKVEEEAVGAIAPKDLALDLAPKAA